MKRKTNQSGGLLKNYRLAILGFGSQGQAQALNLRDSGLTPTIGLPPKSKSRIAVRKAGFRVVTPRQAIDSADIISVLLPDHKHQELFNKIGDISSKTFIFAHGLSVAFGLAKLPDTCDTILIAPHGPGLRIRELYQSGKTFTAFWAVNNDASGKARQIASAYAAAIGCPPKSLFKTSFRDEAIGDIFGEQAVLCGGLVGLIETGFDTLVRHGLSPESAYLECVYQLDLIIDLIKKFGPAGMFEQISKTAAFGSLQSKGKLFDRDMARKMEFLYREIESGRFARSLMNENKTGMKNLNARIRTAQYSPLQKAHNSLAKKLSAK